MIAVMLLCIAVSYSQNKKPVIDKAVFQEGKSGFYSDSILKDIRDVEANIKQGSPRKYFTADFSGADLPTNIRNYVTYRHNPPLSQGATGTCWCFAATSFFESEVYRLYKKEVKLSEMFTVYWEYVNRAADFVRTRGETYFEEGSESNAVPIRWEKYGIVPLSDYKGIIGRKYHYHGEMIKEMKGYLQNVKENNEWNEEAVTANIKAILNEYLGEPPSKITVDGVEMTPVEYLENVLKLRMNDYFSFMSTMSCNYHEQHELVEPDNWFHGDNYYNLPPDEYLGLIKKTIESGYSVCICGDISEPGYDRYSEVAMIPQYDIPSDYIDENARQFRLSNNTTTDDHCIHLVGYQVKDGAHWFLVKDSASGAFDGKNRGYRFFHEDYIKLKMMNILIHKDTAKQILDTIIK